MTKYKVTLTVEEHAGLEQLVAVGKAAARKLTHARILLLADTAGEERTDQDIADALGTTLPTTSRVRHRFVTEGTEAAASPRPQPPRPDKVKIQGDAEQELIRVACSDPPQGRALRRVATSHPDQLLLGVPLDLDLVGPGGLGPRAGGGLGPFGDEAVADAAGGGQGGTQGVGDVLVSAFLAGGIGQ